MVRQFKPLPEEIKLTPTLARRLNQLREFRNFTVRDLAHDARLPVARIEDLEGGLETWLSTADRQRLAKSLAVEPRFLQEVESRQTHSSSQARLAELRGITQAILEGERDLHCPQCASILRCSVQEGLDLQGEPICFAKAFCLQCPFVLA